MSNIIPVHSHEIYDASRFFLEINGKTVVGFPLPHSKDDTSKIVVTDKSIFFKLQHQSNSVKDLLSLYLTGPYQFRVKAYYKFEDGDSLIYFDGFTTIDSLHYTFETASPIVSFVIDIR